MGINVNPGAVIGGGSGGGGSGEVDLSNYYTKQQTYSRAQVETKIDEKIAEIPTGGGAGFEFAELSDHIQTITTPSEMDFFTPTNNVVFSGTNINGSVVIPAGGVLLSYFKTIQQTFFRLRLQNSVSYNIIPTVDQVDIGYQGGDPFEAAGGKPPIIVSMGENTITTNGGEPISLSVSEFYWLDIVLSGTQIIGTISGQNVFTIEQYSDANWMNVIIQMQTPEVTFAYDLTETAGDFTQGLNMETIQDMVIYHSDIDFNFLGRKISVDDYVQLHENKTKVLVFPQLSRIYDFDVVDLNNRIIEPLEVTSLNDGISVTETSETLGSFTLPALKSLYENFSGLQSTPDVFMIDQYSDGQLTLDYLKIKPDLDTEGTMSTVYGEYQLAKGNIYRLPYGRNNRGSASMVSVYFYAGDDRDTNYIRLKWSNYPNVRYDWYISNNDPGGEVLIATTTSMESLLINLKDGIGTFVPSNVSDNLVMNASDFTKQLDFTNAAEYITVGLKYEVEEEAATADSFSYHLPIENDAHYVAYYSDYINSMPVVFDFETGSFKLTIEREKSVGFYFTAANNLNDLCENLLNSNGDLEIIMLNLTYNPTTQIYTFLLSDPAGITKTGSFALGDLPETLEIILTKPSKNSMVINLFGQTIHSQGMNTQKLFVSPINGVYSIGDFPTHNIGYDLTEVIGISNLDLSKINQRDRIRILGGSDTILGKTVEIGDIVEFFNNKTEVIVTKAPVEEESTEEIQLVVKDKYDSITDRLRAWYDPKKKRIMIGGTIYYGGYGAENLFKIELSAELYDKLNAGLRVGTFADSSFSNYAGSVFEPTKFLDVNAISVRLNGSSTYMSGYITIPDTMIFTVN